MNDIEICEAVSTAIRHIGIGTYSSGKIYNYLQQKGFPSAVCKLAVDELVEREYINDYKAGMKIVRTRQGSKQESKALLKQRLIAGGINSTTVDLIISELDSDYDTCVSLFKYVYFSFPDDVDPYEFIHKAIKYAAKRGYSPEIATKAFREHINSNLN